MRRLIIRISKSERKPIKVKVRPGTTCRDVLAHLELPGYVLAPASDPLQEFPPEMDLFRQTRQGQRLIAMTRVEAADRFIQNIAYGSGDI